MNYKKHIASIIAKKIDQETAKVESLLEVPNNPDMGDYALPCFKLASIFRKAPVEIANALASSLSTDDHIMGIEAVNGFLNFRIEKNHFAGQTLKKILQNPDTVGQRERQTEKPVVIESSSPNIAKPFHIGHLCSTIIGHSLSRLYETMGYKVVKVNHLGDWGTQFGKLIYAYRTWGDEEALREKPIDELLRLYVLFHEKAKEKPVLEDYARKHFLNLEKGEKEEVHYWTLFRDLSLKEFKKSYDRLGVTFDSYHGESFYVDQMDSVIDMLDNKKLLSESDGAKIVNLEPYGMPSCILVKSDGASIYATRDIAAAIYRRKTYDFHKNMYVVGLPQSLHFRQFFKVLELAGHSWSQDCVHVGFAHVRFADRKLSTRQGDILYLDRVLDESVKRVKANMQNTKLTSDKVDQTAEIIGVGAVIFAFLKRSREKEMVFSWEDTLSVEGESGPYIHYTYARGLNILKKADTVYENSDVSLLKEEVEMKLIMKLSTFDEILQEALNRNEPMVVARYVIDIASLFNTFYNSCRVIGAEDEIKKARLALTKATCIIIKKCLYILGIQPVEAM